MVVNSKIIIFDQLLPSMLSQIQDVLNEYVLETLVVSIDLTVMSNEVLSPYLKSMHHCG
jgi:hypothetical protein